MRTTNIEEKNVTKMTADIRVYCDPRLKELASEAADKEGIALSELVVRALAAFIKAPKGLEKVPRISFGRPRKKIGA
jgi:hypothetical protein